MQKLPLALSIFLLSAVAASTHSANAQSSASPRTYIVMFKRNAVAQIQVPEVARQMAQNARGRVIYTYQDSIQGTAIEMPEVALKGLQNHPLVELVEVDRPVNVIRPMVETSTVTTATSTQEVPWGITRVGGFGDGTGKTAWVIDTGIDLTHPDLRVDKTRCFTAFKFGTEAKLGCNDGNGHGTHVAGTIAALNNTIGVVGVAAGATVVPVKVLDTNGSGTNAGVIAGIDYVASRGRIGDVANLSLGGGASTTLDNAVIAAANKGIKFVVAAGNQAKHANTASPARANGANIFTISAFAEGDYFAAFSNYGNPPIDYAAPGVKIQSTWKAGGYATINGTSMATPHAAGILLLGAPNSTSNVIGDPDGIPDRIIQR